MNDFAISVSGRTPSLIVMILFWIWIAGILTATLFILRSSFRLHRIKKSALPLQNSDVRNLYNKCIEEMHIKKKVPIYSTAFLTSPVITGTLCPRIYLPIRLITDYKPEQIRYILLHELQHELHKDNISNYLLVPAGILYWFNPLVRLAGRAMKNDREIACDSAVLDMLSPDSYKDYGHTLLNFAENTFLSPVPFSNGLCGPAVQLEQRILNIAFYKKPSLSKRFRSITLFAATALLFAGTAPALTSYAASEDRFQWDISENSISHTDLSSCFKEYDGCFVLYSLREDHWNLYNEDMATMRSSPDSTYKIYDALFALEEGIITPEDSLLAWDRKDCPFEAWEQDQDLQSAMAGSVNWYFETLDNQIGKEKLHSYFNRIKYGNRNTDGSLSTYWMESTLKISPVEQVELLRNFRQNSFGFNPDNIYFFACEIQAENNAAGSRAAEITREILAILHLWE